MISINRPMCFIIKNKCIHVLAVLQNLWLRCSLKICFQSSPLKYYAISHARMLNQFTQVPTHGCGVLSQLSKIFSHCTFTQQRNLKPTIKIISESPCLKHTDRRQLQNKYLKFSSWNRMFEEINRIRYSRKKILNSGIR